MAALADLMDVPGSDAFTADQQAQTLSALDRASAVVRAYCRRQFTAQQFTNRIRARGQWVLLPQRPVVSVQTVSIMVYGTPTATTGWVWDGLDRIWIGNLGNVINLSEDLHDAIQVGVTVCDVVYTAGYTAIPDDVVAITAGLAVRALQIPQGGVITHQQAGPFSYNVATWAQGGPLSLSDAEKDILKQYRRAGSTVELRS